VFAEDDGIMLKAGCASLSRPTALYPLRQDEKCHFLAIDFDKDGWQDDVSALKDVCMCLAEGNAEPIDGMMIMAGCA
jgi:hypothetical protein